MKKFFSTALLCVAALSVAIMFSCSKDDETGGTSNPANLTTRSTVISGVVINGVCWAECNVDAPGSFAATPEAAGKFYQWNRIVGWFATGSVTGWDGSSAPGDSWEAVNDPSPSGWRMPTASEFAALLDTAKVEHLWITQNGVKGMKFTDKVSGDSIFLPAAGRRATNNGALSTAGANGYYWSGSPNSSNDASILFFDKNDARSGSRTRNYGLSVRCVRAEATGVVINGVTWAECNVDAPGTFAATSESAGMFYQWNRTVGWPATGSVSGWDSSDASGDSWEAANDPSPEGWRVPTRDELETLLDEEKVTRIWTMQDSVNGMKFTDKISGNSIFLPAAGYRYYNGLLLYPGDYGDYWSGSFYSSGYGWHLYLGSGLAGQNGSSRSAGHSVRCVLAE